MTQNACQQMPLAEFYSLLRNKISSFYNVTNELKRASEFLNTMDTQTATNMTMDDTTRDDIAALRTAINEILNFYDGTSTSSSVVLKDQINKLRYI